MAVNQVAKRISIFLIAGFIFLGFVSSSLAAAPESAINPHGNYIDNTKECARCHNAHTGLAARLLKETNEKLTCFMCHDGTQSNYNVKSGTYWNGAADLSSSAGGFDTVAAGFTSIHDVEQSTQAPGGLEAPMYLSCSDCHNPHGYPSTNNFRMLQKLPGSAAEAVTVTSVLTSVTASASLPDGAIAGVDANLIAPKPQLPSNKGIVSYIGGIDSFCNGCHSDYGSYGSANTASNAFSGAVADEWNYRHRVGVTLDGGSNTGAEVGDNYWRSITFPAPGLYSSLPTLEAPSGALVTSLATGAGTLPADQYAYLVTSFNYGGAGGALVESLPGNVELTDAGVSGSVTVNWQPVTSAVGYAVYRAVSVGGAVPAFAAFEKISGADPLWDSGTYSFIDDGSAVPIVQAPPSVNNAKIMCLTCHYAHGTKAAMEAPLDVKGSRLLRLDNRAVCEDCHKK